jgi:DNA helicase II / ATP-dependent DNA helicase PcrA
MTQKVKQKSAILEGLNEKQEKAITFGDGPLLIIAGAGTGKTTVLTRRIAWLIEQGHAQPEEILALTFTEKAAAEMNDRVDQLMPLGYSEMAISTFHAFAQGVLSQHALDLGLPGDFKVMTDTQAWMMMEKNIHKLDLDYYRPMGNPTKFIHSLLKHFQKAKGEGVTPEAYLNYAQGLRLATDSATGKTKKKRKGTRKKDEPALASEASDEQEISRVQEIANAYHHYQKMLLDNGYLDFGDLINYTVKLFQTRPKILKQYQAKFKYILVDEFQDTDLAQYEMVKLVASPRNNVTVVGDDDQSIYKFRGASISNILKFKEDFPGAKEITLTDNYRSTQPILDLSYDFIQLNNPERLETRLKISKKLLSHSDLQGEIKVLHAQTGHDEAVMVIDRIMEFAGAGLTFNDFAILVRANDHAEPFIQELSRRGIPYMYVANRGLYKKPFILDLLAYSRLLDNYHESDALFRVLNLSKFKIQSQDLITLGQACKKRSWSLFEAIKQVPAQIKVSEKSYGKLSNLMVLLEKHTAWARYMPVSELLLKILEDLEIMKELAQDSVQSMENRNLMQQFYFKAQNFEVESEDKTLKAFLNRIQAELNSGDTGELAFDPNVGPEAVKVMTVHSSKGLEYKCVFVVNMVEARFPSRDRKEQIELPMELVREILSEGDVHLMEERRLFYVAMTRAKQYLYLTWANDYGGSMVKKPSRFLVETKLEAAREKSGPTGVVDFKPRATLPLPLKPDVVVPETYSWTSISSFLKCPLEFKYKYLYLLPTPGNSYTSFGQSIHKAIELYSKLVVQMNSQEQADLFGGQATPGKGRAREVQYPPVEKLKQLYGENWVDEWYESKWDKDRFKQRGYRLLENFHKIITDRQIIPKETEKFFKLRIGDYKYVGKIDCIYENPDGSINLVDYKTSAKARAKLDKVDKKQLLGYQLAAQEFMKKKVKCLSYWDLEDLRNIIEFLGTPEELAQIKQEFAQNIEEIVTAIRSDSFYELDLRKSHDCEYRDLEVR